MSEIKINYEAIDRIDTASSKVTLQDCYAVFPPSEAGKASQAAELAYQAINKDAGAAIKLVELIRPKLAWNVGTGHNNGGYRASIVEGRRWNDAWHNSPAEALFFALIWWLQSE